MENLIVKTTDLALFILSRYISPGDHVVDATAGKGHDTLALAKLVGPEGRVYAFDIQEEAIHATNALLTQEGFIERCNLFQASHHQMIDLLPKESAGAIAAVIFNLGYLPGGRKETTTALETTLAAVEESLDLIKAGGLLAITMYSGHPQGLREKEALLAFAAQLPAKTFHAAYTAYINQNKNPPELLVITKKKGVEEGL